MTGMGINPDRRPEVRVRMGRKAAGGGVEQKDMFHLCTSRANGSGMKATSDPHPSFSGFNSAPPERRRELRGSLVHATWTAPERFGDGCAWSRFDAQKLPGHESPPGKQPTCSGDGAKARRWVGRGTAARFVEIACPGDACEFRQYRKDDRGNDVADCKRSSTLVFQLRWREEVGDRLPCSSAFIESGGPVSLATMQWWGFYRDICAQWRRLLAEVGGATPCPLGKATGHGRTCPLCQGDGATDEPNLYGMPIRLSLQQRTSAARQARIWVPELYMDFPAGQTLQGWLAWKAEQAAKAAPMLCGRSPLLLEGGVAGARETVRRGHDDIDADYTPVEPPARGGR